MLPEERKEGSPRFGKLHFPVGLWINSPKKRLAKMSRRWPSAGSVRSTSSDTPSRASDPSDPRPIPSAAPAPKAKPPRHKRLSHLFHRATTSTSTTSTASPGHPHSRWASEKKLSDLRDGPAALPGPALCTPSPPCILKIFGGAISRGANYKSVLATPRCSARALVREALERYGLDPEDFARFALCDVVGRPGGAGGAWQGEHLREVGDAERPLLLQELWKPKAGWSRRFEIRRREDLERERERDGGGGGGGDESGEGGDGAGLPPPSRRLHRNRSRAASGGPAAPARGDPGPAMRRSISDLNLSTRRRQRKALSVAGGGDSAGPAPPGPPPGAPGTPEGGDGDGGPGLELLSQCLIQPPRDRPYFLLLRGYGKEDFVLFIMTRPQHIFGRLDRRSGAGVPAPPEPPEPPPQKPDPGPFSVVDTFLDAPDLLPRHCLVQADPAPGLPGGGCDPSPNSGAPPSATVRPFRGAPTTLNGTPLFRRAPLRPGDLLGLGEHVLLLYKDPRAGEGARPPWAPPPRPPMGILGVLGCAGCGRSPRERRERLREALRSPRAELRYRPQDEGALLRDILSMDLGGFGGPRGHSGGPGGDSGGPDEGLGGSGQNSGGPGQNSGGADEDSGDPRGDLRGPGQDLRGPGEDLRGPGQDLRGPGEDLRGPGQNLGGSGQDLRGPGQDSGGPGQDLRGPKGDLRGPKGDLRGPDEDSGVPDEDSGGPEEDSGGPEEDLGALAPAFLLGLCLEHAAKEFPAGHFPELLGRVAGMLRETVGVSEPGTFWGHFGTFWDILGTRGLGEFGDIWGTFPGAAGESGRDAAGNGRGENQGNRGPAAGEPPGRGPPPVSGPFRGHLGPAPPAGVAGEQRGAAEPGAGAPAGPGGTAGHRGAVPRAGEGPGEL
ncbi:ras-interacting protein 1 isoform X2 [Agelaius tricolor]|uniref:ras-interacting protein 1 isoform X2 n=1 Tax=Agelaius tricolor TaxID=9191 RepID=UPI0039F1C4E3